MVIIPYSRQNGIHLHHWILYLFICISSIWIYIPHFFIGFSMGLSIQGIQYKDSFSFICHNPYND